jgi:general secretion pathway protein D
MKNPGTWALALILAMPAIAPAAEESSAPSKSQGRGVQSIEINELIAKVAKRSGKQFIVDPRVRAEIALTGLDVNAVDYARLLAILSVYQYVAFEAGGVVRVIPDASMRQLPVPAASEVPAKALDDEVVTVILQVKNSCSAYLVPVLRPLMPQAAHLAAMPSNALILVDHAANARRIADMVERLDKVSTQGGKCSPDVMGFGKIDAKPEPRPEPKPEPK